VTITQALEASVIAAVEVEVWVDLIAVVLGMMPRQAKPMKAHGDVVTSFPLLLSLVCVCVCFHDAARFIIFLFGSAKGLLSMLVFTSILMSIDDLHRSP
jgi:hypothetical protein